MATKEATEAERPWLEAKKIIHGMQKKLDQMSKDDSSNKKLADLDSVEHMLESLRLTCMATTFSDFKFAHDNRVLDKLWQVHSLISTEYKKVLQRHRGHGQIVQFRNIEKQYAKHLKTAQYFYKGFVERLSARYRLVPLQRIARSMKSESIKLDEVIDAEEAHLSEELTVACYRTLLHLGDLARYRMNTSRQKGHSPDMALTYYGLAQQLLPQEGDAHHQMAVVMADQHRDFGVVYHFFRSWAVQHPNNLVPQNLASEFKKLLQPPPARKAGHGAPDPYDTFGSWLIRLHAHYFKGEDFSQQAELEREVLHRWEVLLKSAEQPVYLQKALLTSIAAYDVALRRVKEEWSAAKSRSCQFILCFLVQTLLVLSRVLEAETQRLFGSLAAPEKTPPGVVEGRADRKKKSSASDTCLALFRTGMAWILAQHADLVQFQNHLHPHIVEMHRAVTRCLSLFVDIIAGTNATPVPYLLPEDAEVLGLAPLDGWTALRQSEHSPVFKVRMDETGVKRLDPALETLSRIYDVVECAIKLVSDDAFPWLATTFQDTGREVMRICYKDDYLASPARAAAVEAPPAAVVDRRRPSVQAKPKQPKQAQPKVQPKALPKALPQPLTLTQPQTQLQVQAQPEFPRSPPAKSASAQPLAASKTTSPSMSWSTWSTGYAGMARPNAFLPVPQLPAESEVAGLALDVELDLLDSETFSRVETFLSPPEVQQPAKAPTAPAMASSSSYDMHTSSANEIFGQLKTPSLPRAAAAATATNTATNSFSSCAAAVSGPAAKPFPSLPWEFVYQPTPYQQSLPTGAVQWGQPPATTPVTTSAVNERMSFLSLAPGQDSRGFPTSLSPVGTAVTASANMNNMNSINNSKNINKISPWAKENRLLPQQLLQAQAETLGIGLNSASPGGFSYTSSFTTNSMSSMPSVQSPRGLPAAVQNLRKWQEAATAWGRGVPESRDIPTGVRETALMAETNTYDRNALLSALEGGSPSSRYNV